MKRDIRCTDCSNEVIEVDAYLSAEKLEGMAATCSVCGAGKVAIRDDGQACDAVFVPDDDEPTLKSVSKGWLFGMLVLALVGCAEPVDIEPEPFTPTCDVVVAEELAPVLEQVAANLGTRPLGPQPVRVTLTVSDHFEEHQLAGIFAAADAWSELTNGLVQIDMTAGVTECQQRDAIHGAPAGECSLTVRALKGAELDPVTDECLKHCAARVGWAFGGWSISMRDDDTRDPAELYWIAVHEIGHQLRLGHSRGFMDPYAPNETWLRDEHFTKLASNRGWWREDLPEGRIDEPFETEE